MNEWANNIFIYVGIYVASSWSMHTTDKVCFKGVLYEICWEDNITCLIDTPNTTSNQIAHLFEKLNSVWTHSNAEFVTYIL